VMTGLGTRQRPRIILNEDDYRWAEKFRMPPPRPRRECGACQHFIPDPNNPLAGLGWCNGLHAGIGKYPGVDPMCPGWSAAEGTST